MIVILPLPCGICPYVLDILFVIVTLKTFNIDKSNIVSFTRVLISNTYLDFQLSSKGSNV